MAGAMRVASRRKTHRPLEVWLIVKPHDPADQINVEMLTEEAFDRLVAAVESAGFEVLRGDTSEGP
jgi:hypothetical protein